jgi:hypothetical protein
MPKQRNFEMRLLARKRGDCHVHRRREGGPASFRILLGSHPNGRFFPVIFPGARVPKRVNLVIMLGGLIELFFGLS